MITHCSSVSATLYRFVDLGLFPFDKIYLIARRYRRIEVPEKPDAKPIPQSRLVVSRLGSFFPRLAVSAFLGGAIHGGELAGLLKMKLKHLPKLEGALGIRGEL